MLKPWRRGAWTLSLALALPILLPDARAAASQTIAYTYDAAGRLTSATYDDTLTTTFTYDLNGNILAIETTSGTSDAPPEIGEGGLPKVFALDPPIPNPMRSSSAVGFRFPKPSSARLEIHDIAGRRVRVLLNGILPAGTHRATWDGRDDHGRSLSAGIYFLRLSAEGFEADRRLCVLR